MVEKNDFSTEGEQDNILLTLTDDLIVDAIIYQIENFNRILLNTGSVNILDKFNMRVNYLLFKHQTDDILTGRIKEQLNAIYMKIAQKINEVLSINLPSITYNLNMYVRNIYHTFIVNYEEMITNFFISYIINNKSEFSYPEESISLSFKKICKDKQDAVILSNFGNVIDSIISMPIDLSIIAETLLLLDADKCTYRFLNLNKTHELWMQSSHPGTTHPLLSVLSDRTEGFSMLKSAICTEYLNIIPKKKKDDVIS